MSNESVWRGDCLGRRGLTQERRSMMEVNHATEFYTPTDLAQAIIQVRQPDTIILEGALSALSISCPHSVNSKRLKVSQNCR